MIRVAAYARVSTDMDDQANSFESQINYFTDYINREPGWELVKIYSDEGISGTNTIKRDGFNEMIADALAGGIDFIITKEVSRFARNTLDSIAYTRMLKDRGIYVWFVLDGIKTSAADSELRLTLMAALAQEESRKTSERVKWGQKRQMEAGVVFGRDLLGYKVKGGQLYLVEEEAEIVRQIFHKYCVEGKGTHVIARELKEAGVKTHRYMNDWSNTVILRILRQEKYVGDLRQKKTYTKSYLDHKKRYNRGAEEQVYIKDHHPDIAIISREMWDATQAELLRRAPSEEQKAKHSNRYWASGKIFCGECGGRFINKLKTTSQGTTRSWNCMNHVKAHAFREAECDMHEMAADKSLKSCVLYVLNQLVSDRSGLIKEIQSLISVLHDSKSTEKKRQDIKDKIDKIEAKKVKLIDMRLDGEISAEELKAQKVKLDKDIGLLKDKLVQIEQEDMVALSQAGKIKDVMKAVEDMLSFTDADRVDEVLGMVVERITVHKGHTVDIKLKDVPLVFRVVYKSTGKLDTYRTEIVSCEMV